MPRELIYKDEAYSAVLHDNPQFAYCINRMKPVDAVEVVRCKDCKHYWLPQGFCKHDRHDYQTMSVIQEDDDFCSYGERREGE